MEKIVWQPSLGYYEFNISLDKDFAYKMIQAKIPIENQDRLNKLANRELEKMKVTWKNPYIFYEDSCFVKEFYIGHNGVGLHTNYQTLDSLLKNDESLNVVKYYSHNVDTSRQVFELMNLFGKWIDFSDVLKEK